MAKREMGFEIAMEELEDILAQMTDKDVTLERSIELYARAAELIHVCNGKLDKAAVQVREIEEKLAEMEREDDL